ncbi:hypothetical protein [Enterobacter cloacae]|uniref:hypothetical protein n=1 Tax=Enterobacter cloacae TaxID=550 RepID=UPI00335C27DF
MSGLVNAITSQISASGLRARDNSGRIVIDELSSPYAGGSIGHSSLPVSVFGSSPVDTAGVASSGGSAAVPANLRLAYDSATGTKFSGIPVGLQRLTLYPTDYSYKITGISGLTITVGRVHVTTDSWRRCKKHSNIKFITCVRMGKNGWWFWKRSRHRLGRVKVHNNLMGRCAPKGAHSTQFLHERSKSTISTFL